MADFYLAEPASCPELPAGYQWVNEQDIADYALPRLIERLLAKLPQE